MPFANADASTIHYNVRGTGSNTLLLIMGMGGHASEWGEPFLRPLAERYRVVTMDNRGIGESQTSASAWSMRDMADDARAVLDALQVERAYVAGTSMGGMISQQLAIDSPARVARLILVSTSFGGGDSIPPKPIAHSALLPPPGLSSAERQRRAIETLAAPGFGARNSELLDQYAELRGRVPTRSEVFFAQFNAIQQSDRSQQLAALELPTLILHGKDDVLVPVENAHKLAERIPGSQLRLFDHCGHYLHIEVPAAFSAALLTFLG
jgi:3-oxoadipate enol-lactonase